MWFFPKAALVCLTRSFAPLRTQLIHRFGPDVVARVYPTTSPDQTWAGINRRAINAGISMHVDWFSIEFRPCYYCPLERRALADNGGR